MKRREEKKREQKRREQKRREQKRTEEKKREEPVISAENRTTIPLSCTSSATQPIKGTPFV